MVHATCRRRLRDAADVEDAVQEVFLRLARHAGEIRTHLATWLHACAVHVALDKVRRNEAQRRHELAWAQRPTSDAERDQWLALQAELDAAIDALDPADRDLIIEHYLLGRSQREVAAVLGVNQSTVQRRTDRAVTRLREQLLARGADTPLPSVAAFIAADLASAQVPASLTASLTKIGLANVAAGGGSTSTFYTYLKGLYTMATATPTAKAVSASLALALLAGTGATVYLTTHASAEPPSATRPVNPAAVSLTGVHFDLTKLSTGGRKYAMSGPQTNRGEWGVLLERNDKEIVITEKINVRQGGQGQVGITTFTYHCPPNDLTSITRASLTYQDAQGKELGTMIYAEGQFTASAGGQHKTGNFKLPPRTVSHATLHAMVTLLPRRPSTYTYDHLLFSGHGKGDELGGPGQIKYVGPEQIDVNGVKQTWHRFEHTSRDFDEPISYWIDEDDVLQRMHWTVGDQAVELDLIR
jgi:RNA polymerase sigma-70 factor (ECF subfamily)